MPKQLTELQKNARDGNLLEVLFLLRQGTFADSTTLYLAVERGHMLIAEVLLACGANKEEAANKAIELNQLEMIDALANLHLNRVVQQAVFIWAIKNYYFLNIYWNLWTGKYQIQDGLLLIQTLLQDSFLAKQINSFIEYAENLKKDKEYTPGYHVSMDSLISLFKTFKTSKPAKISVAESKNVICREEKIHHTPDKTQPTEIEELLTALALKNYVEIYMIIKKYKLTHVINLASEQNQADLTKFIIMTNFPYDVADYIYKSRKPDISDLALDNLCVIYGLRSLLYQQIKIAVEDGGYFKKHRANINLYSPKEKPVFAEVFLRVVDDIYPRFELGQHISKHGMTLEERLNGVDLHGCLSHIRTYLKRLNYPLFMDEKISDRTNYFFKTTQNLTAYNNLTSIIGEFLSSRDLGAFGTCSRASNIWACQFTFNKYKKHIKNESLLLEFKNYLEQLRTKIKKEQENLTTTPFYKFVKWLGGSVTAILGSTFSTEMIIELVPIQQWKAAGVKLMHENSFKGYSCYDLVFVFNDPDEISPDMCNDLRNTTCYAPCMSVNAAVGMQTNLAMGIAFTGITFIVSACYTGCKIGELKSNINHDKRMLQTYKLSKQLQEEITNFDKVVKVITSYYHRGHEYIYVSDMLNNISNLIRRVERLIKYEKQKQSAMDAVKIEAKQAVTEVVLDIKVG